MLEFDRVENPFRDQLFVRSLEIKDGLPSGHAFRGWASRLTRTGLRFTPIETPKGSRLLAKQ
jgi:hypothetical protein